MKADRDPFKEKLNYNAGVRLITRLHREVLGASIRLRNYTHHRIMKDKEEIDCDLAFMINDAIAQASMQLRMVEQLMGRLMHDEAKRSVARSKK